MGRPKLLSKPCRVNGCGEPGTSAPRTAHGYCAKHYKKLRRWGDPLAKPRKAFCPRGHPRTPENIRPGRSDCAVCHRERALARARAKGARARPDHCPKGHPRSARRHIGSGCGICHREAERTRRQREPERYRKKAREYARAHPEENAARAKAWKIANVDRARAIDRRQARARLVDRDLESLAWTDIIIRDPCSYCGGKGGHVEHIVAVNNGGTSTWDNLTGSCGRCNSQKRTRDLLQFLMYRWPEERSV